MLRPRKSCSLGVSIVGGFLCTEFVCSLFIASLLLYDSLRTKALDL